MIEISGRLRAKSTQNRLKMTEIDFKSETDIKSEIDFPLNYP